MLKFVSLSLAASAVLLAPAQAQGTNQPATNAASSTPAEKKICKRVLRSGTNARQKFCLTKAEWKKIEDDRL